jgi:hypothetical protein
MLPSVSRVGLHTFPLNLFVGNINPEGKGIHLGFHLLLASKHVNICSIIYSIFYSLIQSILLLIPTITYVEQSIISWTGCTVTLICTTVDMWSHRMVPCPFSSHHTKKQLRACMQCSQKVTVLKSSCLR